MFLLPAAALATAIVIGGFDVMGSIAGSVPEVLAVIVVGSLLAFALVNWWEEAAWTGFALERLQPRLGPIGASVVTTWLQALIHLPLVFIAGGVTDGRVSAELVPFYLVALFVLPIPVRIALTWLYNASGRSVPVVGLAHAGLGVAAGSAFLPAFAPGVDPVWVYAGFAVVGIVILAITRGRLGFGQAEQIDRTRAEVAVAA